MRTTLTVSTHDAHRLHAHDLELGGLLLEVPHVQLVVASIRAHGLVARLQDVLPVASVNERALERRPFGRGVPADVQLAARR